jgi:hypothetical protein
MDSKLKKLLSELTFEGGESQKEGVLDRIGEIMEHHPEIMSPMPKSVPAALGLTPKEFMEVPMERFVQICEAADYRKVTSSLNYIAAFSGKDLPEVEKRVAAIRSFLKEWKAGKNPDQGSSKSPKSGSKAKSSAKRRSTSEGEEGG